MMAMPIMVVTSVKSINSRKSSTSHIRERTIVYEGSSGPRELLEAIVIQAQAALKGLEPIKIEEEETVEMSEEQKRITNDDKGKGKDVNKAVAEENEKLLGFCTRILATARAIDRSLRDLKGDAFVDRLHTSLPKIPGSASAGEDRQVVDAGDTEESAQKAYIEWANRVRFEYCDLTVSSSDTNDDVPNYKFYYNNEARMLASSDIPKRSLAIAKEVCH